MLAASAAVAAHIVRPAEAALNRYTFTKDVHRKPKRTLPNRHARKRAARELRARQQEFIMRTFEKQVYEGDSLAVVSMPMYDTISSGS